MSTRLHFSVAMRWFSTPALILTLLGAATSTTQGQATPKSLAEIEAQFDARRDRALADGGILSMQAFRELSDWLVGQLGTYLSATPRAEDRIAARLRLVAIHNNVGQTEAATKALRALEPARASMLELLDAAEWAQTFRDTDRRTAWIDAALAKQAPFAERMRAGMVLMTRLLEVERAEQWFASELAGAEGDASKAEVLWHRAAATREREDRQSGDYETALDDLAQRFSATRFGGIARDRLRAMAYEPGKPAVELRGKDLHGQAYALSTLRGKVVLQFFWSSDDEVSQQAFEEVTALVQRFSNRGFEILSVALDERRADLDAFVQRHPTPFRTMFEAGGFESSLALRANVEHVPHLVLVDRAGNIVAPTLTLYDAEEIAHVARRIETALGPPDK